MIWKAKRNRYRSRANSTEVLKRRTRGPEHLESRRLLAADPLHVGVVYLETDYLETDQDVGSDSKGDRFIVSFNGGVANTKLTEVRIKTDKDGDGLSIGDSIYDNTLAKHSDALVCGNNGSFKAIFCHFRGAGPD